MFKNKSLILASASLIFCQLAFTDTHRPSLMEGNTVESMKGTQDGFVSLFDGISTKGWHSYGKSKAGGAWEVNDGTLHLVIQGKEKEDRGDLVTDQEYENFHLKLEWKISERGNSGIIFNIHEDPVKYPNTYNTGLEMQVLDNDKHGDGKIHKHRTGDLYDLIASSEEPVKPVGEWNLAEIVVNNGKLDYYLNGVNIVSTTLYDDQWKELVAGSKFRRMPGFGTYKKGKIALQDHDDEVWYRNIMIKKL